MIEEVDAAPDGDLDLLVGVDVRPHDLAQAVRLVGDRPHLLQRQPGVRLDDVGASFDEPTGGPPGLLRRVHRDVEAPVMGLDPLLRPVLDPAAPDEQPGAGDLPALDALPGAHEGFELSAGVPHGGHPVGQELRRRQLHDLGVVRPHHVVPRRVVAVPDDV